MAKQKKETTNNKSIVKNRKASYEYFLEDRYVVGIVITGPEIKSIRAGKVTLSEAYAYIHDGILKVKGLRIAEFKNAGYVPQDPDRVKLLLAKKTELKKIINKLKDQGTTIVCTELFINEKGYAKLEIALAKGKKLHDKRDTLKDKDIQREIGKFV